MHKNGKGFYRKKALGNLPLALKDWKRAKKFLNKFFRNTLGEKNRENRKNMQEKNKTA